MIQILNDNNFNNEVARGVSIVDFFTSWCNPCKVLEPVFEELSKEMKGVNFFKVDLVQSLDTVRQCKVATVPTMIILKDGQIVDKMIGSLPKEYIKAKIQAQL